jgi:hypothetical protein
MVLAGLAIIAIGVALYFIPSFVAYARGHRNTSAIVVLNLLLGWTFIGWAISLVWAMTANTSQSEDAK